MYTTCRQGIASLSVQIKILLQDWEALSLFEEAAMRQAWEALEAEGHKLAGGAAASGKPSASVAAAAVAAATGHLSPQAERTQSHRQLEVGPGRCETDPRCETDQRCETDPRCETYPGFE